MSRSSDAKDQSLTDPQASIRVHTSSVLHWRSCTEGQGVPSSGVRTLVVAVNRLETFCDASVPSSGEAVGGWVSYEEAGSITCFQGNGYLGVAETREAECMAVAEGMGADLEMLDVGVGFPDEVVVYTDTSAFGRRSMGMRCLISRWNQPSKKYASDRRSSKATA